MQPREALKILDQVTAGMTLNRQQHAQVSEAVVVLAKLVNEAEKGQKPDKE